MHLLALMESSTGVSRETRSRDEMTSGAGFVIGGIVEVLITKQRILVREKLLTDVAVEVSGTLVLFQRSLWSRIRACLRCQRCYH